MKRLLILLLLLSPMAFSQGGVFSDVAWKNNPYGTAATITVGTEASSSSTCTPLASIYTDSGLTTPKADPFTADSRGNFSFYAAAGRYRVCITGTGITAYNYIVSVPAPDHNLLSATHTDSTAAAAVRGGFLAVVGATPKWTQIAHGATGTYPKWNGTDPVMSSLAASGVGSCINQVVTALTGDTAPTCTTPDTSYVSTGLRTFARDVTIFDPVAGDSGRVQFEFAKNVTITRVYCNVKAATSATINLNKRTEGGPDVGGTDALTSNLVCITTGANTSSFASAAVPAHTPVALTILGITGTPDTLRINIEYTVDTAQ
jgi:hypothetical protein